MQLSLQWGRVLMNAEGRNPASGTSRGNDALQWGRVLMNAEGVLAQDLQYQQLDSKIASAFCFVWRQRTGGG